VYGVFVKGWYPPGLPCTWAEDRRDAMRVAAALNIPFTTLDASGEYKQGVIDYLLREYRAGRTPNPDIMCNREVKFGALYRFVREHGGLLATGHYARAEEGKLYRGIDPAKDQSYFLWAVPGNVLKDVVFPLGEQRKEETRAQARTFSLPVAEKRDSQGICFLGAVSVDDFLRAEFGSEPGKAVDADGKEVGAHDGVLLVTLGERVSLKNAAPGPWYVVKKDVVTNTLTVAKERLGSVPISQISLEEVNLLGTTDGVLEAQYRYHGPIIRGTFDASSATFTPREPLPEPIAAGQSLVLYRDNECIGGGIMR